MYTSTPHKVYGSVVEAAYSVEAYKNIEIDNRRKKAVVAKTNYPKIELDLSYLPAMAEAYCISPNPSDYIIVPLPIVTVEVPNRNSQAFTLVETASFDVNQGSMVYETFRNKCAFEEHNNTDPTKAKGAILDASMQYIPEFDLWKINAVTLWDRTKDRKLVQDIIDRKRTGYSMGAYVMNFLCSICGHVDEPGKQCEHMRRGKGSIWGENRRLAYQLCSGTTYFEISSVSSPADVSAVSQNILI